MLDQALRFGAILNQPEFADGGNLAEIGSGSQGIAGLIAPPPEGIVAVDVAFAQEPVAGLLALRASALRLPFRDDVFDRVICSDVLEHIPVEHRARVIAELLRVTRRALFLACPCGEAAQRADAWLDKIYRFLRIRPPVWLEEHLRLGLPEPDTIRAELARLGADFREAPGESARTHRLVSLLISNRLLNRIWECLFFRRLRRARRVANWQVLLRGEPYRRLWVVHP